jgi:hypothetical protein
MSRPDMWLNIPRAESDGGSGTGTEPQRQRPAFACDEGDLRLAPRLSMPVAADATMSEMRLAFEKFAGGDGCSDRPELHDILRKVQARLIAGVTVKGCRQLNLPLEVIDAAEFARLEFDGITRM